MGPTRVPIPSFYGILEGSGQKTAVIEMAAAAGLSLVPRTCRDPCVTTTFGVGQLITAALDEDVQRIITDVVIQAPVMVVLRLREVQIEAVCNWDNVLCGPKGVARVYGPQKGANEQQTELLAAAMDTYATVAQRTLGVNVSQLPGSGASGGLGTGLLLIGAVLRPRYEAILEYFNLDDLFDNCDLVFTAEGGIDDQTPRGKIPAEVAMRAEKHHIPVIALAGTVGPNADLNYHVGINAYVSILQQPSTLEEAIRDTERLLTDSAECAMRMVMVGKLLGSAAASKDTKRSLSDCCHARRYTNNMANNHGGSINGNHLKRLQSQ
ncbi:glycerate kinase family protein [Aspergillus tanneri]|uniref:Glycerate kinase n=1 Tax=Aspergillus tanneri TaxID=1220188 RepID=A0A5M9MQL4_9EURO|nr:uncharacterized protein ATNIH1004_005256 [Aspergillus tanneri]KAA8649355.1 hypothetical protein ATNIH1004_005256 [Aspergillus tanneri]